MKRLAIVLGFTSVSMLMGCAHQQIQRTVDAPPVAQLAPTPAKATPADATAQQDQKEEDLTRLLSGTVIRFEFNADLLTPDSRDRLQTLATAMRSRPTEQIKISGNCDERGTEEYNLALGQRRADVAKDYLVSLGVERARVTTVTYGAERPADPGHSESAWSANRRDEFGQAGN